MAKPRAAAPPPADAPRVPESELWQCPVCLDTLREPMLTTCCGQSFCRECLDGALRKVDACPMCRAPLLSGQHSMTRNRALDELLKRMATSQVTRTAEREVLITIRDVTSHDDDDDSDARKPLARSQRMRVWCVQAAARVRAATMALTPALQLQQWRHWMRIHWATLQCVFYVFLFGVFVFFLRVQEEEFAEHNTPGGH